MAPAVNVTVRTRRGWLLLAAYAHGAAGVFVFLADCCHSICKACLLRAVRAEAR